VSLYERAPGTTPVKIVTYPSRSPVAKPTPSVVAQPAPALLDASYAELIIDAATSSAEAGSATGGYRRSQ
jgi:hypothetical protein